MTKHKRQSRGLAIRPQMVTAEYHRVQLETMRDETSRLLALQRASFAIAREMVVIISMASPRMTDREIKAALADGNQDTLLIALTKELQKAKDAVSNLPGSAGREQGFSEIVEIARELDEGIEALRHKPPIAGKIRDAVMKYAPADIMDMLGRIADLDRGRTPEAWRPGLAAAWHDLQAKGVRPIYVEWPAMLAKYESIEAPSEDEQAAIEFLRRPRTDKQKYDQLRYLLARHPKTSVK